MAYFFRSTTAINASIETIKTRPTPRGLPSDLMYFLRIQKAFSRNPQKTIIYQRAKYDEPQSQKYDFRNLLTDTAMMRASIMQRHRYDYAEKELAPDGTLVDVPFTVGLIADRSYEFVVNLFGLLTCGMRPAIMGNTARRGEMNHMMLISNAKEYIAPTDQIHRRLVEELELPEDQRLQIHENPGMADLPYPDEALLAPYKLRRLRKLQGTILFTSGTTGRPKAAFTRIAHVAAQCDTLAGAWKYTDEDHLLHVLPTHHIHGLVNCLLTPLSVGASVEFTTQPFSALAVLKRIARPASAEYPQITMFHGVPTMYTSMVHAYQQLTPFEQQEIQAGLRRLRVAVCGSAALPVPIAEKWKYITGSYPLERYGMTETGMTLSNPLDPEKRKPGSVGKPLHGVVVQLRDPDNDGAFIYGVNKPGELLISWQRDARDQLFHEYVGNDTATQQSRARDPKLYRQWSPDWFATGDIAVMDRDGDYSILGRDSVDIIKVAGHKVSALEIERVLLEMDEVEECAVLGISHNRFGQLPLAMVCLKPIFAREYVEEPTYRKEIASRIRKWCQERLSAEKIPRKWMIVEKIPRNAMGKVNKKLLLKDPEFFPEEGGGAYKAMETELTKKDAEALKDTVKDLKNRELKKLKAEKQSIEQLSTRIIERYQKTNRTREWIIDVKKPDGKEMTTADEDQKVESVLKESEEEEKSDLPKRNQKPQEVVADEAGGSTPVILWQQGEKPEGQGPTPRFGWANAPSFTTDTALAEKIETWNEVAKEFGLDLEEEEEEAEDEEGQKEGQSKPSNTNAKGEPLRRKHRSEGRRLAKRKSGAKV